MATEVERQTPGWSLQSLSEDWTRETGIAWTLDVTGFGDTGRDVDDSFDNELPAGRIDALLDLLSDFDIAVRPGEGYLQLTTLDLVEARPLTRIYWVEALCDDRTQLMPLIESLCNHIEPVTWEAVGGSSSVTPTASTRPGLTVSAPHRVHLHIGRLPSAIATGHVDH